MAKRNPISAAEILYDYAGNWEKFEAIFNLVVSTQPNDKGEVVIPQEQMEQLKQAMAVLKS